MYRHTHSQHTNAFKEALMSVIFLKCEVQKLLSTVRYFAVWGYIPTYAVHEQTTWYCRKSWSVKTVMKRPSSKSNIIL